MNLLKGNFDFLVSTGSTLLDLAISGGKVKEGGIPGGIIVEVFGPPGVGKTAILSETCGNAQRKGGSIKFLDPEGRLDAEYSRIYGMNLEKENYARPNTVSELFDEHILNWKPDNKKAINIIAADSLAALTTELELEKGDKMGMKRGKEFSQGLRKTCRLIRNNNWIILCSNQIRQGEYGEFTPGGFGIPFYSSLRIKLKPHKTGKHITRKIKFKGKDYEKIIGIKTSCKIEKSIIDDPYREADIYIIFGYGIDDIRGNLQFIKETLDETTYDCFTKKYKGIEAAIKYIEEKDLVDKLRNKTIELWHELENSFKVNRKNKR